MQPDLMVAGADAGTECIKVVVLRGDKSIAGMSIVPTSGYFQECIQQALNNALAEAHATAQDLSAVAVTGFGASCAPTASLDVSDSASHARAAFHHRPQRMTLLDIGGREPKVIYVDSAGRVRQSRSVRKCAVGIGTFLMFTARHLNVHPTRLMDLAVAATDPANIGSYCSVFAEVEVIERLRDGASAESIALGCMYSIADRIVEMGGLEGDVFATGGVCEYFPGVVKALSERTGRQIDVLPDPIANGAFGAALLALDSLH